MPCYNKVKWISGMFDSIINQKWENIELILVNDGSNDGTREIITAYEPQFNAHRYEVVIIDQENQGVAAAVRNGLMRTTGEFICQVDADDELDSEYVSSMAGWLLEHPKDQWIFCDLDQPKDIDSNQYLKQSYDYQGFFNYAYPHKIFESFLLYRVTPSLCSTVVRKNYLLNSGVLNNFCVEPRVSQEPQVNIPLSLGNSRPIHLHKALYRVFKRDESITKSLKSYSERYSFTKQYLTLIEITLSSKIEINSDIHNLLQISRIIIEYESLFTFLEYDEIKSIQNLVNIIQMTTWKDDMIKNSTALLSGFYILARYISNKMIGYASRYLPIKRKGTGKIIAYAAFGRASGKIKCGLINSNICPDVFWDIAAKDDDYIDGIPVIKPDFRSLDSDDIILILLVDIKIAKTVAEQFQATCVGNNIFFFYDVADYLVNYYFDNNYGPAHGFVNENTS